MQRLNIRSGHLLCIYCVVQLGYAQINTDYVKADPFYLTEIEQSVFTLGLRDQNLDIRPFLMRWPEKGIEVRAYGLSRFYFNDNVPNLENTGELWVGKGYTFFNSLHLNLNHKNFFISLEPYYQYSSNLPFTSHHVVRTTDTTDVIVGRFNVLNDGPGRGTDPVNEIKLREAQLYIHKNGIGGGVANCAMWWGPGIHSTLNMTNNTTGFPHLVLGTLREQHIGKVGLNLRYVFAKLGKNQVQPFFTAMLGSVTAYTNPIITLGASRTFLSGGTLSGESVTWEEAALLPFQSFLKEKLYDKNNAVDPSDKTDQTFALFLSLQFPESGLKLFLEYGWNDHRWDWYDLRAHPDHSGASVLGFRKYGLFSHPELVFGFEYANLKISPFYPQRATPDWYGRPFFDYSVYDGRRYAAHSGSDSDDMLLYFGYVTPKKSLMIAFNYERHGIIYSVQLTESTGELHYPEDKLEFRIDYRHTIKSGQMYFYYEYEFAENLGSPLQAIFSRVNNPERKANVFGIGFESTLFPF